MALNLNPAELAAQRQRLDDLSARLAAAFWRGAGAEFLEHLDDSGRLRRRFDPDRPKGGRFFRRPRLPRIHSCAACNADFEAVRIDARFCSNRCRQRHYRDRVVRSADPCLLNGAKPLSVRQSKNYRYMLDRICERSGLNASDVQRSCVAWVYQQMFGVDRDVQRFVWEDDGEIAQEFAAERQMIGDEEEGKG